MFRVTIRDVSWLMLVVGLVLSLWHDCQELARQANELRRQESELRRLDLASGRLRELVARQQVALRRSGIAMP